MPGTRCYVIQRINRGNGQVINVYLQTMKELWFVSARHVLRYVITTTQTQNIKILSICFLPGTLAVRLTVLSLLVLLAFAGSSCRLCTHLPITLLSKGVNKHANLIIESFYELIC